MIKPGLFICLTLFLTGLLPGTAKPEMAVEDTGFEEVEITGLFSVGGKPMVSLSIRNSSSFTLSPGQRSRGIKLLQVKGDDDPFVVLERNGLRGRVFLNKSRPSVPVNRTISLSQLEKREGVQYVKGETEPFTGTAIANYEDNSKWETPYKTAKGMACRLCTVMKYCSRKGPTLTANGMALVLSMTPRPEGRCLKPSTKTENYRCEWNIIDTVTLNKKSSTKTEKDRCE